MTETESKYMDQTVATAKEIKIIANDMQVIEYLLQLIDGMIMPATNSDMNDVFFESFRKLQAIVKKDGKKLENIAYQLVVDKYNEYGGNEA